MKKIVALSFAFFTLITVFSSCKKDTCYECTVLTVTTEYCEDTYTSVGGISFEDFIANIDSLGGTCTKK